MLKRTIAATTLVLLGLAAGPAIAGETPSAPDAKVYFINLMDGDTVTSPLHIKFGLSGMGIAPAGAEDFEHTGHHHLIIDEAIEGAELDEPIPADEQHRQQ